MGDVDDPTFLVTHASVTGIPTPFIHLTAGEHDFHVRMAPQTALLLAHRLIYEVEMAITDAFLLAYFKTEFGFDRETQQKIIEGFSEWRSGRELLRNGE